MSTKEKSRKRKTSKSKTNATDGTVQLEIGISRSKGMLLIGILSGILLGLMVGVGGAYFGIVPTPEARALEIDLENAAVNISGLEKNIKSRDDAIEEIQAINLLMENDANDKKLQIAALESSIHVLDQDISIKAGTISGLEDEGDSLRLERESLQSEMIDLVEQINQANSKVSLVEEEKRVLNDQIFELQLRISRSADLENRINNLQDQIIDLNTRIASLRSDVSSLRGERDSLAVQLANSQRDYSLLKTRWDLWEKHKELSPPVNDDVNVIGYLPNAPQSYYMTETAVLISFEDPDNCLRYSGGWGRSMQPAQGHGHTTIRTVCFDPSSLRPGDIIVFRPRFDGEVDASFRILHQIVELRADGVITKGIFNDVLDQEWMDLVRWEDIDSLVVAIIY